MTYKEDIDLVRNFLSVPLAHDSPDTLKSQLADAITWLARISYLKRQSEVTFKQKKNQMLIPKSKDYTDLDRNIILEANVAEFENDYGTLNDFCDILSKMISSAQTLINAHKEEVKRGL